MARHTKPKDKDQDRGPEPAQLRAVERLLAKINLEAAADREAGEAPAVLGMQDWLPEASVQVVMEAIDAEALGAFEIGPDGTRYERHQVMFSDADQPAG